MGRSGIPVLLAAIVIVVAASAGGWMALNGGGNPEPAAADTRGVVGEPAIGPSSDIPEPRDRGVSVAPSRLANMKPSPATIGSDSGGDSFVADYGWVIALAIAASLAAGPIVGIYELRGLRLGRE